MPHHFNVLRQNEKGGSDTDSSNPSQKQNKSQTCATNACVEANIEAAPHGSVTSGREVL